MPTTLTEKMPMTAMPRITSSERIRSAGIVAMSGGTGPSREPGDRQADEDAVGEQLPGDRGRLVWGGIALPPERHDDPVHHDPQHAAVERDHQTPGAGEQR